MNCTARLPSHTYHPSPSRQCVRPIGHGGLHRCFFGRALGERELDLVEFPDSQATFSLTKLAGIERDSLVGS